MDLSWFTGSNETPSPMKVHTVMIQKALLIVATILTLTVSLVQAQDFSVGPRIGYTKWDDVSQVHFGGHLNTGDIFPNIAFRSSAELGFGDGYTIVAVNGDVVYRFTELTTPPWGFYSGASLAAIYLDHDLIDSNVDLGFSGVAGVTKKLDERHGLLGEIRIGLVDSPDVKITFGYTFF
ncbi:MAG: hypothetical protein GY780_18205 [bacterium]|nr:hypothetical protein [bacterium]